MNVKLLMVSAVERLFVNPTFLAALVVPTVCATKVNEAGETVAWAMPVPVSDEVSVL